MRYINLHFTYLLTYLLTIVGRAAVALGIGPHSSINKFYPVDLPQQNRKTTNTINTEEQKKN